MSDDKKQREQNIKKEEKSQLSLREEEILEFWQGNKIFEKSLEKGGEDFVFYDGPPFATGLPHYGHILAGTIKDAIARYQTMKGFKVPRKWGWDCHGLPIENIAEKELGIKQKTDIEKLGIDKFNEFCRSKVSDYVDEWKKIVPRLGRWADMETPYKTMDLSYMESVWWVFKQLYDKGLIYEGYRSMHICTRCETTLSQQEVAEGYKDVKDLSATVKFELVDELGTFVLAWTTTPWTLIGNVALAVGKDVGYVKIKVGDIFYILAESRLEIVKEEYSVIEKIKGNDLVGKKYKPLFDYYIGKGLENEENGWKIYAGDFVTTEDGTGVVHIAPAFGEDDLNLGKANNLPFIQHVGMDGKIKEVATEFAGLSVKPQEDHQKTDIEVIKSLAHKGLLFAKEKYEHSYPHCWRCETPLINYATSSWFVGVTKVKEKALELAKEINWSPEHIKEGRFGNWLEGARDWSISRQRFWASAMPIWKCDKCEEIEVLGSIEDIKNKTAKSGNNYFIMRHGEAENNVACISSNIVEASNKYPLTDEGIDVVKRTAEKIKDKKIDLIISSDFLRTKQTAELVAATIGYDKAKIVFDEKLREIRLDAFNDRPCSNYHKEYPTYESKFADMPEGIESLTQLKKRMGDFLYNIESKYKDLNILFVSHEYPIWLMVAASRGLDQAGTIKLKNNDNSEKFIDTGEIVEIDFVPLPHNKNYELDLHRPYIDEVKFPCAKCGGVMSRIPDVLDTWFDSGSMPYAQSHYPFENKEKFEAGFPADFIGEGVDQTRAWFYYLHVIATSIKDSAAFKNVIVNGIVLAEDGKKMSKRLQNYPDPMDVVNKYGADSLRYYLLSSPAVRADSLSFSEKGVQESSRKVVSSIFNSLNFLKTYVTDATNLNDPISESNILDKWILVRLKQVTQKITERLDGYDLAGSSREFIDFFDDLSNWYVRRSRARFQHSEDENDFKNAVATLAKVLSESAKLLAPFAPFTAEAVYQDLKTLGMELKESVHLDDFPKTAEITEEEKKVLVSMETTRTLAELCLAARASEKIEVKQPLGELIIGDECNIGEQYTKLVAEEANIKEVHSTNQKGKPEGGDNNWIALVNDKFKPGGTFLNIEITEKLKLEGSVRKLMRNIQELRKSSGLVPQQKVELVVSTDETGKKLVEEFEEEIKKTTKLTGIKFGKASGDEVKVDDMVFKFKIEK